MKAQKLKILLVIIVASVMGLAIGVPAWRVYREQNMRLACIANLKGVATSAKIYLDPAMAGSEQEREAQFRIQWQKEFGRPFPQCPRGNQPYRLNWRAIQQRPNVAPDTVIAYEPLGNHDIGASVVFSDGHGEFVRAEEFHRLMAKSGIEEHPTDPGSSRP